MSHSQPAVVQGEIRPVLFETVVDGGYCIGCGLCAAFSGGITMQMNSSGQWEAALLESGESVGNAAARVCPFADGNLNEDALASDLFPDAVHVHPLIGRSLANYAGFVREEDFRQRASSGGLVSWVLCRLLEGGHADAVVHVGASMEEEPPEGPEPPLLFRFVISRTTDEVRARAKSRYYPVEMSGVVRHMLENPGRYVVVGLPCFIKALRLACRESEILQSRVTHTVGIVCGHLKSRRFAEMMAWQCGIEPDALQSFDFRTKRHGAPANSYAITATGDVDGKESVVTRPVVDLFGSNWGYGFFKYKACDFCDDVLAETADIAVGDAWLPEYVRDSGGTSIVTVRTSFFQKLLEEGVAAGNLQLEEVSAQQVADSQEGGFRHRRDGLSFRLEEARVAGSWIPSKRVAPGSVQLSSKQCEIFRRRQRLAALSHEAFRRAKAANRFGVFVDEMAPEIRAYDRLYLPSIFVRIVKKALRLVKRGRSGRSLQ